jgi:predicted GH43/DUF377 family glycosyl hydrolase
MNDFFNVKTKSFPNNMSINPRSPETQAGWKKLDANPVLGGNLGTCFDISVMMEDHAYKMWFSWRPKESIAFVESDDGNRWTSPRIVLGPNTRTKWEQRINRPVVIKHGGWYEMWYTGQSSKKSWIGYATSQDGVAWTRASTQPVLSSRSLSWERRSVMCPHVLWDEKSRVHRMWYSAGGQYEPRAIGYATSKDGIQWTKLSKPVFTADPQHAWEQDRVAACQVIENNGWFVMFYIGFSDLDHASIGIARSRDGISGWERHPANPVIAPGPGKWDGDACYKPFAIFDGSRWLLWYNGRQGSVEQIGLACHEGEDLGFE